MWCHTRHENLNIVKNPQRISKLDRETAEHIFDYQGVDFPVKAYDKIEVQNHIKINVFGYENKQFYPIYKGIEDEDEINIRLLISDGEKQHYVLIKDFNRMIYNKTKSHHKKHF